MHAALVKVVGGKEVGVTSEDNMAPVDFLQDVCWKSCDISFNSVSVSSSPPHRPIYTGGDIIVCVKNDFNLIYHICQI